MKEVVTQHQGCWGTIEKLRPEQTQERRLIVGVVMITTSRIPLSINVLSGE